MSPKRFAVLLTAFAAVLGLSNLSAQTSDDKVIVATAAAAKFGPAANAPDCFTISVERGDPSKGASVILAKFAPGCVAPFHWHTPSETVMIVSGALEIQMKGDKPLVAHRGDFAYMPPKHVHRATCTGAAPCLVFLTSDAAFDIHWVDADGKEIALEAALKSAKHPAAPTQKP
ncbi:MAG TPA: cupin domain-containing protein [Candidatus Eisenbacteria bacterium]|jgi:quercetin dioxygenase-like cupin family protein|nr:cupin domain-containing protein [Candidatus Eisenbacteria bacterium]